MVQLMPLPPYHLLLQQNPEWFILLVPAYPGCPGKKAVKRLCVCACYHCAKFGWNQWTYTRAAAYFRFHQNPFRGFGATEGRNMPIAITLAIGFYNSLHYRTSRDPYATDCIDLTAW